MNKEQIEYLEVDITEWTLARRDLIYSILYVLNRQSKLWLDALDDDELPNMISWRENVKHLSKLVDEVEDAQLNIDLRVKELDDLNAKQS